LIAPGLREYDVVVFDLDDTLYSENSYVNSGYKAIAHYVESLYGLDFNCALEKCRDDSNVLASVLDELGLSTSLLPQFVQIYRYHEPDIEVLPGVNFILQGLKKEGVPIYLVTDGRSITQRLKITALGIKTYFCKIFISEEQGHEKPSPHSFEEINNQHKNSKIVYIGDNPKKDFIAPHKLHWDTIGIKHNEFRVHPLLEIEAPRYWVENIGDLSL